MDLSIIVSNYRKDDLIPLQLRMIRKQWSESRDMKIEVIIVDHYSHKLVQSYFMLKKFIDYFNKKFPELNISLYIIAENTTFNYNIPWNVGVKRAKGEFVMFLPSDGMPLTPFHKYMKYHEKRDIILKTGLINLPSFANWILSYDYDFKKYIKPCPSMLGASIRTKHYHTIRGLLESQSGVYTHGGLIPALLRFTPITEIVCATDLLTIHFDREIHPEFELPFDPVEGHKIRGKYAKEEKQLTLEQRNPDGWGESDKLVKLI